MPALLLLPGDIVLTFSTTKLGRFIRWGERSRGEAPSRVNHGALAVKSPETIVEADVKARRCSIWDHHLTDGIIVYRPLDLTAEQIAVIVAEAEQWPGRIYPVQQLFPFLLDNKLFGGRHVFRRLMKFDPLAVCSRIVAIAYGKVGLTFGRVEPDPDDIDDYCSTHPAKYAIIYEQPIGGRT